MDGLSLDWNTIIAALGPTGILVWYLWYTTSVALPKKDAEFTAVLNNKDQEFTAVLNKIVTDFRDDLREERKARAADVTALRAAFECRVTKD